MFVYCSHAAMKLLRLRIQNNLNQKSHLAALKKYPEALGFKRRAFIGNFFFRNVILDFLGMHSILSKTLP